MGNFYGNMMGNWGCGTGLGIFGGFFMSIIWVLIIWLIVSLVRGNIGHRDIEHGKEKKIDTAIDTLRERYAKGEISKEEFEEKSQLLKK